MMYYKDLIKQVKLTLTINLCDVVLLYKSLLNYVNELRDRFDDYEVKGKIISKCENYEKDDQRKRNISKRLYKYTENGVILDGKEAMKINIFFVIIDKLVLELSERSKAYTELDSLFNFFSDLLFICQEILKERTKRLVEKYSNDLDDELYEKCLHFKQFLNEIEIKESDKKSPGMFLKILREKKFFATFPNLDTALKMYLTIILSNATGERSFSILKRIKNYLSNSISDIKVSSLASFSANSELLESMNFDDLINTFTATKSRKRQI